MQRVKITTGYNKDFVGYLVKYLEKEKLWAVSSSPKGGITTVFCKFSNLELLS